MWITRASLLVYFFGENIIITYNIYLNTAEVVDGRIVALSRQLQLSTDLLPVVEWGYVIYKSVSRFTTIQGNETVLTWNGPFNG